MHAMNCGTRRGPTAAQRGLLFAVAITALLAAFGAGYLLVLSVSVLSGADVGGPMGGLIDAGLDVAARREALPVAILAGVVMAAALVGAQVTGRAWLRGREGAPA